MPTLREVKLTDAEIDHVFSLLMEAKKGGDYYGPREQYYARTDRIIRKLADARGGSQ